jgi:hypothetical protein
MKGASSEFVAASFDVANPSGYFIVPNSERVVAPTAESCWNAACGSYCLFQVGGLSFSVDCHTTPEYPASASPTVMPSGREKPNSDVLGSGGVIVTSQS